MPENIKREGCFKELALGLEKATSRLPLLTPAQISLLGTIEFEA